MLNIEMESSDINKLLPKLNVYRFSIVFQTTESMKFPRFKGLLFRQAFGIALKKYCCTCLIQKKSRKVESLHEDSCPYGYLFANHPKVNVVKQIKEVQKDNFFNQAPRPFLFDLFQETQQSYLSQTELKINMTLFGDAIHYLPYIVLALKEMAREGIDSEERKLKLIEIMSWDALNLKQAYIYHYLDDRLQDTEIQPIDWKINFQNEYQSLTTVKVKLVSPLRVGGRTEHVHVPTFTELFDLIWLRYFCLLLYYQHGSEMPEQLTCNYLKQLTHQVSLKSHTLKWINIDRFSNLQTKKQILGGMVGELIYEGNFKALLPLLQLGQWTAIGKNTAFGLGQIRILLETVK